MCAVAAGIPISGESRREERMGHVSGDAVSAARAVEAVQARDTFISGARGGGGDTYFIPVFFFVCNNIIE